MATFRRRGTSWHVEIRRRGYPSRYATFDSKADAKAWADEIEGQMRRRRYIDTREAERVTLGEALDRYCAEVSSTKKGYRQERYRIAVIKRHDIAKYALANIRGLDIARYRDDRLQIVSPITVNNELILLSNLFSVARREWDMGVLNPLKDVRRPRLPPGRDRRISPDEERALIKSASPEMGAIIVVAIETGMRRGEIAALRREWIGGNVARLPDTKISEARDVPLSTRAIRAMQRLPARIDGRVFGLRAGSISHAFHSAVVDAGLDGIRFHDLRHEATSRFFESGLNIMEVSAVTGHKTLAMLKRYTHPRASDLARKLG